MDIFLSSDAYDLYYIEDKIPGRINFEISDTTELNSIADVIRQRYGYIPFFDESAPEIWGNGWYDFYLQIDVFKRYVTGIGFTVQGNNADKEICPDNRDEYWIDEYTSYDEEDVMKKLITELRKRHTSLDEIEKEVREYV